jgi:uncharacterized protein YjbI with pentapeptide repeats
VNSEFEQGGDEDENKQGSNGEKEGRLDEAQREINEFVEALLRRSIAAFNEYRRANPNAIICLHGMDFSDMSLVDGTSSAEDPAERGINLRNADLSGSILRRTVLTGADLYGATLVGADLTSADCFGASFQRADLRNASLSGASLCAADLRGATLSGVNATNADFTDALISGAELDEDTWRSIVQGLRRTVTIVRNN